MRIVHLVSTFPPYHGGMGRVAAELSTCTARQGHDVTVITPTTGIQSEEIIQGVKVIRLRARLKIGNAALMPNLIPWLQGYDVVHIHWPWIGGLEPLPRAIARGALRTASGTASRVVMQYHMDLVGDTFSQRAAFWYEQTTVLPRLVQRCDAVVCSSNDYRDTSTILAPLLKMTPPVSLTIPLGVDDDRFTPAPADPGLSSRWGVEPNMRVIGFVGALDQAHYFKGLEVLLSAFPMVVERLPRQQLRLLIVGSGDRLEAFERIVRNSGMDTMVQFTGSVDDTQLVELYRIMDCLVLPSTTRSEAFGLTILEAMACGRAVVASNVPGVRSLIELSQNGMLVTPGDHEDLAQTLSVLFQDAALLGRMGENSRKRVELQYQWSVVANQWIDLYGRLQTGSPV
ncbi:glycosyltransferase family 4 protein [Candidatus Uhrbacteria bacterium]|nr:glycosyltransferase family 4 protein [Candidatus Uhrbacteria bacterium]